jgi:F-type H+-transporting ATPase subunit delta
MNPLVVDNLSRALVELATEKQKVAEIREMAAAVLPIVNMPEVKQFLNYPLIKAADKKAFLVKIFPPEVPQEFINFFHLIIDRRYTESLPDICERVIELGFKAEGVEVVTVVTARELNPDEEDTLRRRLEARWAARVFLKKRHNPALIGGIVIQREDRLYDGSILGRIKSLRRILTEQSV